MALFGNNTIGEDHAYLISMRISDLDGGGVCLQAEGDCDAEGESVSY